MNLVACNYAVARFLPYPETGEFVNIGIVLACAKTGYLDYLIEAKRRARVHDFFPELERETYQAGLHFFTRHLRDFRNQTKHHGLAATNPDLFPPDGDLIRRAFAELTRPREALFRFGPPSTVLSEDPAAKLKELFNHYVRRQFAQDKEFQEKVMTSRLRHLLQANHLAHFYQFGVKLGDDGYQVNLPFVRFDPQTHRPIRAIKPLDLDKRGPTEIIEHGDQWLARLGRLRALGALPAQMLFAVRLPREQQRCITAAQRVTDSLQAANAEVRTDQEDESILRFAKSGL